MRENKSQEPFIHKCNKCAGTGVFEHDTCRKCSGEGAIIPEIPANIDFLEEIYFYEEDDLEEDY